VRHWRCGRPNVGLSVLFVMGNSHSDVHPSAEKGGSETSSTISPYLRSLHDKMIASGSFTNAAEVLGAELTNFILEQKSSHARSIFQTDFGALPTFYLDELAARMAEIHWRNNDLPEFYEWLLLISKQSLFTQAVTRHFKMCILQQDISLAKQLTALLKDAELQSTFETVIRCSDCVIGLKENARSVLDVIAQIKVLPEFIQYEVLKHVYGEAVRNENGDAVGVAVDTAHSAAASNSASQIDGDGSSAARFPQSDSLLSVDISLEQFLSHGLPRINELPFARSFADVLISTAVTVDQIAFAVDNFRVHAPSDVALYGVLLGQVSIAVPSPCCLRYCGRS